MTAPSDPEAEPETREEGQEIVLRLGDILPRVPAHLLKPGPHDTLSQIRFSVEELAEKISRGRVSVPLERLASVYPDVFRDSDNFPGQQEVQLPLQKLLEQLGLVAPKPPAANGMPKEQLDQARAEANRILEANADKPVPEFATPPSVHAVRIAKAISTARQILGLFARAGDSKPQAARDEQPSDVNPSLTEHNPSPATPPVQSYPSTSALPEPVTEAVPPGNISLRALPIFRLLPGTIFKGGALPAADARVALPLSTIDPQLAEGHVEIPLEDFVKALPGDLRERINLVPEAQVWIPLDEIFQNLPADHLFYMPPLVDAPEGDPAPLAPATEPMNEVAPEEKGDSKEEPASEITPVAETVAENTNSEPVEAIEPKKTEEIVQDTESNPGPEPAPENPTAEANTPEFPSPATTPIQENLAMTESSEESSPATEESEPKAGNTPVAEDTSGANAAETVPPIEEARPETGATPAEAAIPPSEPDAETKLEPTPEPSAEPATAVASPAPSRAPWMRGFQVPPPLLVPGGITSMTTEPPSEDAPIEPPAPAPTPEAKRTVDFLASQTGIFAAAAFVQGAVFASTDFPRRPDLDALREFMGTFIDRAQESGRRLGWNRILTISCEQFHLTAVVRDSHFIVALHHDRVLPPLTHDALVEAADDLSKAAS